MTGELMMPTSAQPPSPDEADMFALDPAEVQAAFNVVGVSPLGRGAFGETWRLESSDGTYRAAKILLDPDYSSQRLGREVEGLQRASSPYVVDLLETVSFSIGGHGRAALVFEFIPGGDLASRLTNGNRIAPPEVLQFALGLFAGLCELHSRDTVHRDIKPANIALRNGDWSQPVILDLGLARVLDRETITAYPSLMGTALYMAPEQLRFERARKAADVFAAGVVLYLMLSGEHPFYAHQNATISLREAVQLIEAGPGELPEIVPRPLAAVVERLLSPAEADRGSARRASRDLQALSNEILSPSDTSQSPPVDNSEEDEPHE